MKKSILCVVILAVCIVGACSKEHIDSDPNNGNGGNNGNNPSSEIKLELSETHLFASSDAITKTVALTANADWSIDQNFTENEWVWCSVTPTYGRAGTTTLTVDIQANGYDKRIHDFSIRSGDTDISLTIEQKQVVSFLIGGSREFIFYDEGGQVELTGGSSVGCEIAYLDGTADWISEEKDTRAFESLNFRFRVAPYDGMESRRGRIVLKAPGEDLADTVQIIQYHDKVIDIPDPYFRKYCLTNFDMNNDGEITKRETEGVREVKPAKLHIRSVRGIEEFADLRYFDCSENQISELDVSKNEKLWSLKCDKNILTSLDVRSNKELAILSCDDNQISTFLFDQHKWFSFSCSGNRISTLGTDPIGATYFDCSNNSIKSLALDTSFIQESSLSSVSCNNNLLYELDLSKCTNTAYLYCNENQLQRLDLSNCKKLTHLSCDDNRLEDLILPENGLLSDIYAAGNRLKNIDLQQSIFLTSLWISENELEALDCSSCVSLELLHCYKNKLQSLNLSNCPMLIYIDCADNLLTTLDVSETGLNKSSYPSPLDCAPMPTLENVYLKEGWTINGINYNRNQWYIPETTQILYK